MTASERRHQLIDSAISLFGQHGLNGTTTKSLADAAGVSEATIFKHFPTKNALYVAAFERRTAVGSEALVATLQDHMDRGEDEELLRVLTRSIFVWYEMDRDLHRMLLYVQLEQGVSEGKRVAAELLKNPVVIFLERFVAQRQTEGAFAPGSLLVLVPLLTSVPASYATSTKLYSLSTGVPDEEVVATYSKFLLAGLRDQSVRVTPRVGQ